MKTNWLERLMRVNKELLLIFSIIAFAAIINFFVAGQKLVLSFYDLPTLFAAYYFGRSRAVQTAIASVLIVCWLNLMNPVALASGLNLRVHQLMSWADITIWGSFLLITAYAMGTLYEHRERSLTELRETYYGVLQILCGVISNDKYTQNHSYRTSIYAARIAEAMRLPEERIEDIRAAALLHDIGKLDAYRRAGDEIEMTDAGRLHGEIALGYVRVRDAIAAIEGFPFELSQALLHIILSHHGSLEHGSPVVPCTREATLVHMVDNLGGRLGSFDRIEKELPAGAQWSSFDKGIGSGAYFATRPADERRAA